MQRSRRKVYDAIVVGSGATGGWAAKVLTEKGLNVLVLEVGELVSEDLLPGFRCPLREIFKSPASTTQQQ